MHSRLAVRNVPLHLFKTDLPDCIAILAVHIWTVHVDVHDMFGDQLQILSEALKLLVANVKPCHESRYVRL